MLILQFSDESSTSEDTGHARTASLSRPTESEPLRSKRRRVDLSTNDAAVTVNEAVPRQDSASSSTYAFIKPLWGRSVDNWVAGDRDGFPPNAPRQVLTSHGHYAMALPTFSNMTMVEASALVCPSRDSAHAHPAPGQDARFDLANGIRTSVSQRYTGLKQLSGKRNKYECNIGVPKQAAIYQYSVLLNLELQKDKWDR